MAQSGLKAGGVPGCAHGLERERLGVVVSNGLPDAVGVRGRVEVRQMMAVARRAAAPRDHQPHVAALAAVARGVPQPALQVAARRQRQLQSGC